MPLSSNIDLEKNLRQFVGSTRLTIERIYKAFLGLEYEKCIPDIMRYNLGRVVVITDDCGRAPLWEVILKVANFTLRCLGNHLCVSTPGIGDF
jgi:hypothetical protein